MAARPGRDLLPRRRKPRRFAALSRQNAQSSQKAHVNTPDGRAQFVLDAFIPARTRLYSHGDYSQEQVMTWLINVARYLRVRADEGLSGSDIVLSQNAGQFAGANRVLRWHTMIARTLALLAVAIIAVLRNGGVDQALSNVRYYVTSFPEPSSTFLLTCYCRRSCYSWLAVTRCPGGCGDTTSKSVLVNIQQLRTHQGRRKLAHQGCGLAGGRAGGRARVRAGVGAAWGDR